MLLEGKRIVVTGVLTDASIAFSVARLAQEEGAEIVLTSFGRARRITERVAKRLPQPPDIIELDVTSDADLAALTEDLRRRWGRVDGALHSIGFAPEACLGGEFLGAGWDDVAVALQVSAYSLASLTRSLVPVMAEGGSVVALDFDARQAWPGGARSPSPEQRRRRRRSAPSRGRRTHRAAWAGPLKMPVGGSTPPAWRRSAPSASAPRRQRARRSRPLPGPRHSLPPGE